MITLNSTCITINALGWVVVLAVAITAITIIGFFNHDAYAASFDIKDQVSCQSLPSGSPSWDPSTNTCTVTNISLTLNSGDSLTVENGIVFVINSGFILLNDGSIMSNSGIINDNSGIFTSFPGLVNAGTINNNAGGIINISSDGGIFNGYLTGATNTITNSGRLTTDSCVITNSGTINNNSGGNIHIEDFNLILNSGTINNSGTIIIEVDSTINNSGAINNLCPDGVINQNGILSGNPINNIPCIDTIPPDTSITSAVDHKGDPISGGEATQDRKST